MSVRLIIFLIFILAVAVAAIIIAYIKCGHFFKALFFSVFTGTGALLAVHFTSLMTSLSLPVNPVSIGISAFGGIPSVVAMILMRFI